MTNKKKAIILLSAIAIFFLFVAFSFELIPTQVYHCEYDASTNEKNCTTNGVILFLLIKVVEFLHSYGEAIVAVFTIAIAAFTWTLSVSTKRLWEEATKASVIARDSANAASLQARASVASQLPVVGWAGIKLVECDDAGKGIRDPVPNGPIPAICRPVISIKNTGPTRILALYYAIKWEVSNEVAEEPHFGGMWPANIILITDQEYAFTTSDLIRLTDDQRRDIGNGARLWVYGFVSYKDFLGDGHRMGNIAKWDDPRGLVQVIRKNYSYHESEKSYTNSRA